MTKSPFPTNNLCHRRRNEGIGDDRDEAAVYQAAIEFASPPPSFAESADSTLVLGFRRRCRRNVSGENRHPRRFRDIDSKLLVLRVSRECQNCEGKHGCPSASSHCKANFPQGDCIIFCIESFKLNSFMIVIHTVRSAIRMKQKKGASSKVHSWFGICATLARLRIFVPWPMEEGSHDFSLTHLSSQLAQVKENGREERQFPPTIRLAFN